MEHILIIYVAYIDYTVYGTYMAKIYVPCIKITCPEFFTVWTYMFIIHIYIHEFTSLKKK